MVTILTLNAPIATKVVCFSCLLKCLRSLYGKQCGPRSDCSYRSSLLWVHAVCFYTFFVSNTRQLFSADDFSRRHFQLHFFLGALRVKIAFFICFHFFRFITCRSTGFVCSFLKSNNDIIYMFVCLYVKVYCYQTLHMAWSPTCMSNITHASSNILSCTGQGKVKTFSLSYVHSI